MHSGRGSRRLCRHRAEIASCPNGQVLEGWLFVTKEGCSWRALPERFGPWHTVYMRGQRWMDKRVLELVFAELQRAELEAQLEQAEPDRPLRMSIDSTSVKVHQDGTGAPTERGARRSGARVACPRLDRGEV